MVRYFFALLHTVLSTVTRALLSANTGKDIVRKIQNKDRDRGGCFDDTGIFS